MIIYLILNLLNSKMYIGKSIKDDITSSRSRPRAHLYGYGSTRVFSAVKYHGLGNFLVLVIHKEDCTEERLNELEKYYIKHFKTRSPNGYNHTDGGDGASPGTKLSEEHKKKISISNKITQNRPEVKERNSEAKLGNINALGYKHTEESKKKQSETWFNKLEEEKAKINTKNSDSNKIAQNRPDQKKKKSENSKLAWSNPEIRAKRVKAMKGKKKSPRSEEHKKKLSLAKIGNTYPNHIKWHWNRGLINVDCKHCIDQIMKEHS